MRATDPSGRARYSRDVMPLWVPRRVSSTLLMRKLSRAILGVEGAMFATREIR